MKKIALSVAGLLMVGSIGFGATFAEANGDATRAGKGKSRPSTTESAIKIEKTTECAIEKTTEGAIKVKPTTTSGAIKIERVKPTTTSGAITTKVKK